jgi:hypothetical protein
MKTKVPVSNEPYVRALRLNGLAASFGRKVSYLEIGVETGRTLLEVQTESSVGVDPHPRFSLDGLPARIEFYKTTSDSYFQFHARENEFDLILVDGLHEWEQAFRDMSNSLWALAPGGVVVLDDVLPLDEPSANPDPTVAAAARKEGLIAHDCWYGDVWKSLVAVSRYAQGVDFVVVGNRRGRNHGQAYLWKTVEIPEFQRPVLAASEAKLIEGLVFEDFFHGGSVPRIFPRGRDGSRLWKSVIRKAK